MRNERSRSNYRLIFFVCLLSIGTVFPLKRGLAQDSENNPLLKAVDKSDYPLGTLRERLIPPGYGKRELTSFEKYRIEETIPELDRAAESQLKQGNDDKAFELWYRRLMLTRALDPIQEIEGLGKIGAIAWKENRGTDVRNIAERLIAIEESADKISFDTLNKLATAYQQVRYLDKATDVYQQIVVDSKKQNDPIAEQKNLETLGELYLARFNYSQAADVYQELLTFTEANKPKQAVYLQNLADIYDRISQPEQAIAVNKRLIALADTQTSKIADLEIAIARDYEALNQTNEAVEAYNRALKIAFTDRELATASDILSRLGELYQDKQIDKAMPSASFAIATYNKLLEVQQQSYNDYGMLDTYDTLGKIYLDSDKTKARQYFQQGLELATSLNHRVKYFEDAIEQTDL